MLLRSILSLSLFYGSLLHAVDLSSTLALAYNKAQGFYDEINLTEKNKTLYSRWVFGNQKYGYYELSDAHIDTQRAVLKIPFLGKKFPIELYGVKGEKRTKLLEFRSSYDFLSILKGNEPKGVSGYYTLQIGEGNFAASRRYFIYLVNPFNEVVWFYIPFLLEGGALEELDFSLKGAGDLVLALKQKERLVFQILDFFKEKILEKSFFIGDSFEDIKFSFNNESLAFVTSTKVQRRNFPNIFSRKIFREEGVEFFSFSNFCHRKLRPIKKFYNENRALTSSVFSVDKLELLNKRLYVFSKSLNSVFVSQKDISSYQRLEWNDDFDCLLRDFSFKKKKYICEKEGRFYFGGAKIAQNKALEGSSFFSKDGTLILTKEDKEFSVIDLRYKEAEPYKSKDKVKTKKVYFSKKYPFLENISI